jgi:Holliday junction resolvasome RuvABC endonuclease subunit
MSGILGLDAATVTGWCYAAPGAEPVWGHHRMGGRSATDGEVFAAFRDYVLDLIETYDPQYLVFEAAFTPRLGADPQKNKIINPQTLQRLYGFRAHIVCIAEERCLICHDKQSLEFTKWFTGRGRFPGATSAERSKAKKAAMVAACAARGWKVTDDEADAIALLLCFEAELYPEHSLRRKRALKQPSGPLFTRDGVNV